MDVYGEKIYSLDNKLVIELIPFILVDGIYINNDDYTLDFSILHPNPQLIFGSKTSDECITINTTIVPDIARFTIGGGICVYNPSFDIKWVKPCGGHYYVFCFKNTRFTHKLTNVTAHSLSSVMNTIAKTYGKWQQEYHKYYIKYYL